MNDNKHPFELLSDTPNLILIQVCYCGMVKQPGALMFLYDKQRNTIKCSKYSDAHYVRIPLILRFIFRLSHIFRKLSIDDFYYYIKKDNANHTEISWYYLKVKNGIISKEFYYDTSLDSRECEQILSTPFKLIILIYDILSKISPYCFEKFRCKVIDYIRK